MRLCVQVAIGVNFYKYFNLKQNKIYIISFFEGAAVMATELCGSKLISPYFGSSLYVWAAVIAVTLGSLAAGYFYGGKLSLKENKVKILLTFLLVAAVYMACMPVISGAFATIAINFSLLTAVVIASVVLLLLPMLLMGAASPIIISIQSDDKGDSGNVSGIVYGISTVGGIFATFLSGFYLIPAFGIIVTLLFFAGALTASLFLLSQKKSSISIILVLAAVIFLGSKKAPLNKNCIYEKDGMLGKIDVLQYEQEIIGAGMINTRKLLVNDIVQTEMDLRTGRSLSAYVGIISENIDTTQNKNALVLGLGGGVTSNMLMGMGYKVSGVELDERIIDVAKKYFDLNKGVETFCDDARHFINLNRNKYDIILADLFKAEEQPVHVLTVESLVQVKNMLNPGGRLIVNWHGYSSGKRGMGTAVLLNTLKESGFTYKVATYSEIEDSRNLVIFASKEEDLSVKHEVVLKLPVTTEVNTDNRPLIEKYNASANSAWRNNYIQYYYSEE